MCPAGSGLTPRRLLAEFTYRDLRLINVADAHYIAEQEGGLWDPS